MHAIANVRNRHRVWAALTALFLVAGLAVGFAVNAKADPASLAVEGENGYKTQRVYHPTNSNCWVDLAVDTQRGFQDETLDTYLSGVARISRGPCAVRVQVDAIRVAIGSKITTDFFPAKEYNPRDNTPGGLSGTCASGPATARNLYADISQQVGCQQGPNRLNSDADYAGNVTLVRGYSDWLFPAALTSEPCSTTMATRGFFAIRWSDGTYQQPSLRTNNVPANPDC